MGLNLPHTGNPDAPKAARGVAYAFGDRRNGWYCFPFDEDGNQLGEAVYLYSKREILAEAKSMAERLAVKVERW